MGGLRLTRRVALRGALAAVVLLVLVVAGPASLLMLSPAVTLLALVALGLFPSDQLIARLRRMLRRPQRIADRPRRPQTAPALAADLAPLAFALAVRPPPHGRTSLLA